MAFYNPRVIIKAPIPNPYNSPYSSLFRPLFKGTPPQNSIGNYYYPEGPYSPKRPSPLWFLGPNSILLVVYMDPLGIKLIFMSYCLNPLI